MATRWAICATGNICNDFCTALSSLPDTEHKIVAVASRSEEKAAKFAEKFGIPKSFGSYAALASLEEVDIVYVGVISHIHEEICLMLIEAGKNVLCEIPLALSLESCRKILTAAREKGVFFLEGYWSRFHPIYDLLVDQIKAGTIGDLRMLQLNFSAPLDQFNLDRLLDPKYPNGAFMEFSTLSLGVVNTIFREFPEKVTSEIYKREKTGADMAGVITLSYSGNRFAVVTFSDDTPMTDNFLIIRGTKGHLKIPELFWCPTSVVLPDGQVKEWPLPETPKGHAYIYPNGQWLVFEAQAVREALSKGLKECPKFTLADSEKLMVIIDKVMQQNGIKYTL